jgi:hypothetical protein
MNPGSTIGFGASAIALSAAFFAYGRMKSGFTFFGAGVALVAFGYFSLLL